MTGYGRRRRMSEAEYRKKVQDLFQQHEKLIARKNGRAKSGNGVYDRYVNPVLTAEHTPLFWRYDFDSRQAAFGRPSGRRIWLVERHDASSSGLGRIAVQIEGGVGVNHRHYI